MNLRVHPVAFLFMACLAGCKPAEEVRFQGYVEGAGFSPRTSCASCFEANEAPDGRASPVVALVFLAIIIAAIWFTVPS
jgi:hypothetical protein